MDWKGAKEGYEMATPRAAEPDTISDCPLCGGPPCAHGGPRGAWAVCSRPKTECGMPELELGVWNRLASLRRRAALADRLVNLGGRMANVTKELSHD